VVVWRRLDRLLGYSHPYGESSRRRLLEMCRDVENHLAMVFHKYLTGEAGRRKIRILVNDNPIDPWDPFCRNEGRTIARPSKTLILDDEGGRGEVLVEPFILPPMDGFSSREAAERASGPAKWNQQQGFYIYRNHRLIQSGGWCGMRAADEHTKLARIAVEFSSSLDEVFNVNIAKMKVAIPPQLRLLLERAVHDVIKTAQATYRSPLKVVGAKGRGRSAEISKPVRSSPSPVYGELMLALRAAALVTGDISPLTRILKRLRRDAPELAAAAGLPSDGRRRSKQQRPAS
jgi:hypothetical protein